MEDANKVAATLNGLRSGNGKEWVVVPNSVHVITDKGKSEKHIKVFICVPTGEVREYLHGGYLIS